MTHAKNAANPVFLVALTDQYGTPVVGVTAATPARHRIQLKVTLPVSALGLCQSFDPAAAWPHLNCNASVADNAAPVPNSTSFYSGTRRTGIAP